MSVKREVIAGVVGCKTEEVICRNCIMFVKGGCRWWRQRVDNPDDDFCSFFESENNTLEYTIDSQSETVSLKNGENQF